MDNKMFCNVFDCQPLAILANAKTIPFLSFQTEDREHPLSNMSNMPVPCVRQTKTGIECEHCAIGYMQSTLS